MVALSTFVQIIFLIRQTEASSTQSVGICELIYSCKRVPRRYLYWLWECKRWWTLICAWFTWLLELLSSQFSMHLQQQLFSNLFYFQFSKWDFYCQSGSPGLNHEIFLSHIFQTSSELEWLGQCKKGIDSFVCSILWVLVCCLVLTSQTFSWWSASFWCTTSDSCSIFLSLSCIPFMFLKFTATRLEILTKLWLSKILTATHWLPWLLNIHKDLF